MTRKRVIGGLWPFLLLLIAFVGIHQFSGTEKTIVLVVPLAAGALLYVVSYFVALACKWSVTRAIIVSILMALVVSLVTGWWLFFGLTL